MTDDQILAVVQAHKEGKKIEHRLKNPLDGQPEDWIEIPSSGWIWNFLERDYRVAPEPRKPREWWLVRGSEGWRVHEDDLPSGYKPFSANFETSGKIVPHQVIRVREVIE